MATQEHNRPVYLEGRRSGGGVSGFLSGVAVLLSTLSLLCSGFAAYKVYELQQVMNADNARNRVTVIPSPNVPVTAVPSPTVNDSRSAVTTQTETTTTATPTPVISPSPVTNTTAQSPNVTPTVANVEIQPGQFVQSAFGTKGQVEILSAKRIADPQLGSRHVVNVQMRVRRVADKVGVNDLINIGDTTARNPSTSDTYKSFDPVERATGSVSLFSIRKGASADAYVWLKVPEGVNSIDVFVPEAAAFKNVPISN